MKKGLKIALSVLMLLLLQCNGTMQEFIHSFAHHTDTVHTACEKKSKGFHFENHHHHCDYLDYALPLFINNAYVYTPKLLLSKPFPELVIGTLPVFVGAAVSTQHLRGPPSATLFA